MLWRKVRRLRVNRDRCRTVDEELEWIEQQLQACGNFFVCDVHPNVVRADQIRFDRLWRKKREIANSLEYKTLNDA